MYSLDIFHYFWCYSLAVFLQYLNYYNADIEYCYEIANKIRTIIELFAVYNLYHADIMNVKERIILFVGTKEMPIKAFEELCGLSNGYVSSMRKGFGSEKLNNVLFAFPELNRNWLLFGEGEMLVENAEKREAEEKNVVKIPVDVWDVIKNQAESLKSKDSQMDEIIALLKEQMSKKNAVTVDGVPVKAVAVGE